MLLFTRKPCKKVKYLICQVCASCALEDYVTMKFEVFCYLLNCVPLFSLRAQQTENFTHHLPARSSGSKTIERFHLNGGPVTAMVLYKNEQQCLIMYDSWESERLRMGWRRVEPNLEIIHGRRILVVVVRSSETHSESKKILNGPMLN